ncbi:7-keto-8-aminopelargonate synthetase and related enzyme [Methylophaga aminisulfidivorans MP]|uniref:8-amino-7-oxononanoate synthase n=1 Tax=Methylophaga aminisulfidivorans MP TaxID=1026882 RepID=F5T2H0_9GAMM|nr:8-amino-7-oxononanoate synthase [Methylophaga aminisulfidivorans]EGL53516.1 7-keto-8-aminopelargonate synthetase and related enzyme [Methylophaga aminisulfidivorans MP]
MAKLPWHNELTAALAERKAAGRYRQNRLRIGEQGVHIQLGDKTILSFCSNDYLGLAAHPAIKQAFKQAVDKEGVGSGAAHLLTGHSFYHQALEEKLADFTGQQRVLLFSTGYMANLGVIDGLLTRGDAVIQDKWNHASLLDGGRLTDADQLRYPHADMSLLHKRLHNAATAKHRLIVSDGLFSMDGDIAPLPEIMALSEQHRAAVLIDDAHGFGVIGEGGRGTVSHYQIAADKAPIVVGTLGKAIGTGGAFVAADELVIETLIQQARSYVYTTAQPPAIAAATLVSLDLVEKEQWRRDQLQQLIQQFRQGAEQLGLELMPSMTPIQPVIIGDDKKALEIGARLEEQGILVGVIRPPTVPKNTARLRITFSAAHTEQDVDRLLVALEQAYAH